MTYKWHPENIVKADYPKDWAANCIYMADAMIRTAQLSLENTGSGVCTDEQRVSSAANTLEVALAMLAVAIDGTETLEREVGAGMWGNKD